jgi:hypothetical protein
MERGHHLLTPAVLGGPNPGEEPKLMLAAIDGSLAELRGSNPSDEPTGDHPGDSNGLGEDRRECASLFLDTRLSTGLRTAAQSV